MMTIYKTRSVLIILFFLTSLYLSAQEIGKKNRKKLKINIPKFKKRKDADGPKKIPIFEKAKDFVLEIEIPPVKDIFKPGQREEFLDMAEIDASLQLMEDALRHFEEIEDIQNVELLKETIGAVHQMGGNNRFAMETYNELLKKAENSKDQEAIARNLLYVNIGKCHQNLGRGNTALEYFNKTVSGKGAVTFVKKKP